MQEPISFNGAKLPNARKLLRNICAINMQYAERNQFLLKEGVKPRKYEGAYSLTENALKQRIQQLEEDILKTSEERDAALEENREKINELEEQLFSISEQLRKLTKAKMEKEKRIRQLEEKITMKVRSHIPSH